MSAQKVDAEQHRRGASHLDHHLAALRSILRVSEEIAKDDRGVGDPLVADGEALEGTDPVFDLLPAEAGACTHRDDARRGWRDSQVGRCRTVQQGNARAGIEQRAQRLSVDLHGEPHLWARFVNRFQVDLLRYVGRPIRQRDTVAILGLVQPDRRMGEVEFDI